MPLQDSKRRDSAHPPLLSVVIVSYNTRAMTLDCLRSLYDDIAGLGDAQSEVFVVDNASHDGSAEAIREAFPQVQLIASNKNLGFGAANNLAMARARGEFFLLLNSDAFPLPGAIPTLLKYLQQHPNVGAVGPKLLNGDGSLQPSCWKFPAPRRAWAEALGLAALLPAHPVFGDYFRWAHDEERHVDFVVGACVLLRRAVYEQVGGFDENFFLYAEETDWMKRMEAAGWPIAFIPWAQVTHLGGASSDSKPGVNPLFFDGQDRFVSKHFGPRGLASFRAANLLRASLRLLAFAAKGVLARGEGRKLARLKMRQAAWLARRYACPFARH
jgi:GT2 family glycosyltransferase